MAAKRTVPITIEVMLKILAPAMAGSTKGALRSHNRPHALDPRRRKFRERFGRHAREAACSLRKAFVRSQTRARSAAVRASCRCAPAIGASSGLTSSVSINSAPELRIGGQICIHEAS